MKRILMGTAFSVLAAISAGAADAQTAASSTIDELVVTAQRREQAAQDVGIAMSVLGSDDLKARGITNVNQLQNAAPSLEIEPAFGGGAAQFRLRGVGFQDYGTNNTPTVGVYVNEVAYPVPIMTQTLLFDIDRVEVLRGPQGTLYGRNTTGGAINFITGKPTPTLTAGASVEFGRFESLKAEGFVAGPITSGIRGRVAFATEQDGGFQHSRTTGGGIGDADRIGARILLDFDLAPKAVLSFDIHGGQDKSENQALYVFSGFQTATGFVPTDTDRFATDWSLSQPLANDIKWPVDSKPGRDNYTYGSSVALNWDFGGATLTDIASYDYLRREEFDDWDATAQHLADEFWGSKVEVWSNELRLTSNSDGPLQWVGGVYLSKQHIVERFYSDFTQSLGFNFRTLYGQRVESASVFGQAEYAFTDQWKLIGGLRYEEETRKLVDFNTFIPGIPLVPPTDTRTKMKPLTGKASLEFKPVEDVLLYASVSRGVKSGGFTTYNTGNTTQLQPFKPEVLWAYETGFKANPLPNVQINGAAYYYDYKDRQVLSAVYTPGTGAVGKIANAPKSEIWGGELELTWKPAPEFVITQSVGYKDGKYKEFLDLSIPLSTAAGAAVFIDRAGEKLPFNNWSYQGSAAYTWTLSDLAVTAEANYSWRDKYVSWLGSQYDIPNYWLANANLTVRPQDGPWAATIWARNVFNEKYDVTRNFFLPDATFTKNIDIAQPGAPRTYGVRLSYAY